MTKPQLEAMALVPITSAAAFYAGSGSPRLGAAVFVVLVCSLVVLFR